MIARSRMIRLRVAGLIFPRFSRSQVVVFGNFVCGETCFIVVVGALTSLTSVSPTKYVLLQTRARRSGYGGALTVREVKVAQWAALLLLLG